MLQSSILPALGTVEEENQDTLDAPKIVSVSGTVKISFARNIWHSKLKLSK